jgi:hypothetical protein
VKTASFGAVDRDHHLSTTYPYDNNFTHLPSEENNILIAGFTEEEVVEAISRMKRNEHLGLDGFFAKF